MNTENTEHALSQRVFPRVYGYSRSCHAASHTDEDEKDFLNGFNGIQRIFFR